MSYQHPPRMPGDLGSCYVRIAKLEREVHQRDEEIGRLNELHSRLDRIESALRPHPPRRTPFYPGKYSDGKRFAGRRLLSEEGRDG